MISGEYLVLKGAVSLAVPLKVGQRLSVTETRDTSSVLSWRAWFKEKLVFETTIEYPRFAVQHTNNAVMSERLVKVLLAARTMNSAFLAGNRNLVVESHADFEIEWGLGSSSSLISNIAWWAEVDPFALNRSVFNGSGYDIACARSDGPILYSIRNEKPAFTEVNFNPAFASQLYFVYLGSKQDTRQSLKINGSRLNEVSEQEINVISEISQRLLKARNLSEFEVYILNHEKIIGDTIGMMPVKYRMFPDFGGEIKSLGAWGGDFILVSWQGSREDLLHYFSRHGCQLMFAFNELVKNA